MHQHCRISLLLPQASFHGETIIVASKNVVYFLSLLEGHFGLIKILKIRYNILNKATHTNLVLCNFVDSHHMQKKKGRCGIAKYMVTLTMFKFLTIFLCYNFQEANFFS